MKRKTGKALIALLAAMVFMTACGSQSAKESESPQASQSGQQTETAANNGKKIKLRFALDQSPTDSWTLATQKFAELVSEKTNGQITVDVHHSGSLGAQRQILEGMLAGTIDGTVTLEPATYWVKDIGLFGIPYLFENQEHLDKFLAGQYGEELNQKMTDAGFRPITYFKRPPRQITSNKPINSLADLKGLKIRVPETPTMPPAFKAMGANPVSMNFSELYTALETGVVDGQENPLPTIYANKFHEVQKYVAYTNHQYAIVYLVISDKVFNSLSEDQKKAILEAAQEAQKYESELTENNMKTIEEDMKKAGVTFTNPDVKEFAAAAKTAYAGYDSLMQDWIKKVQSVK